MTHAFDMNSWLATLGLSTCAPIFEQQRIGFDVLVELSEADLRDIGIAALGDRRRLMKAIAELKARSPESPGTQATPAAPDAAAVATPLASPTVAAAVPSAARHSEERKQLTVMFCDLVDSSALAQRLDPEDMRDLLARYQEAVATAVRANEGYVAQFLGDGVLVYFGYPRSHEDDAIRAVRAGLSVIESAQAIVSGEGRTLQTRVGIATGMVVLGEIGKSTSASELSAIGATPNLAARLQAQAHPGQVVIAEGTRRLVGRLFALDPLGMIAAKGFDQPIAAWRVLGALAHASRFEGQRTDDLSPFVGRGSEVAMLMERWAMARDAEGQLVLLSGEAGIGKSRITQELSERLRTESPTTLLWQCSPYFTSSALYPVVQQLEHVSRIASGDPQQTRARKLESALSPTGLGAESVGYLLKLLGLDAKDRLPPSLTAQQEKSNTLSALIDAISGLAANRPVLLLIEDAHWIDPTTEELLGRAIERLRHCRVLILVTCRPEYSANWGNPVHLTRLSLSRLGQRHCAALVATMTATKALPDAVIAEIVRKTDGIPLFVEELTKTVIESGVLRETGTGYELTGPLPELAIPSTLQDSLMARLDRLAPAKEVAQVGAAIGRDFSHRLLAAVLTMPPEKLAAAIEELARSELLFRRGSGADAMYSFKHALVRDTAYNSMVKSQRLLRHRQIADAIEKTEPETVATQPELLAHHHQEAANSAAAFRYWSTAGDIASKRTAINEALTHYRAALAMFGQLDPGLRTPQIERDLPMKLGNALMNSVGYRAPETQQCFTRALELSLQVDNVDGYLAACSGVAPTLYSAGRFNDVLNLFARVRQADLDSASLPGRANYLICVGIARLHLGQIEQAREQIGAAIRMGGIEPALQGHTLGGAYFTVPAHSYAARACMLAGDLDTARMLTDEAEKVADQLGHIPTRVWALQTSALMMQVKGELPQAERHIRLVLELAERHGFTVRIGTGLIILGLVQIADGKAEEGTRNFRQGFEIWSRAGGKFHCSEYGARAADGLLETGHFEMADEFVALGETAQQDCEERFYAAELLRLRGRLQELARNPGDAEASYRRAIELAQSQGAKLHGLRAATDLARLYAAQGHRAKAAAVLKPSYESFGEGFDYPVIVNARALLEALH